jgi:predicted dehydrogenase
MRKLRVGLIGAAGGVASVHLAAYEGLDCIEVVAGADLSAERLAAVGSRWGIRTYCDPEVMLGKEQLDIACVCVPARYHRQVAEAAAKHGVHVLIEKPLAATMEDGWAIIEACAAAGVKLFYGSSYRGLTSVRKAREIVQDGGIGEVSLCTEFAIGGAGFDKFRDLGPQHYPSGGPGGSGMGLVDHGIHLIDVFSWILGSPATSVFGRGNLSGGRPASEYAIINFANGAVAQIIANAITFPCSLPNQGIFSWGGRWSPSGELSMSGGWDSHPGSFQIYGATGSLNVYHYAEKLFLADASGIRPVRVESRPMPGNFASQMESFAHSIVHDLPPEVPGEAGLSALRTLLGIYESCRSGRPVLL